MVETFKPKNLDKRASLLTSKFFVQTLPAVIEKKLNFLHSQVVGMQKHLACALAPKLPGETFINYFYVQL